ncbi:MAG TPA: hypothetical protein VK469_12005, partial [Candidatus Kapabacteria bacterium]|nr:hypothetical protein [Candidatus Kapabacteria bacterium]
ITNETIAFMIIIFLTFNLYYNGLTRQNQTSTFDDLYKNIFRDGKKNVFIISYIHNIFERRKKDGR